MHFTRWPIGESWASRQTTLCLHLCPGNDAGQNVCCFTHITMNHVFTKAVALAVLALASCQQRRPQVIKFTNPGDVEAEAPVYYQTRKIGTVAGTNRVDSVVYINVALTATGLPALRYRIRQHPYLRDEFFADSIGPAQPETQADTLTGTFEPSVFETP